MSELKICRKNIFGKLVAVLNRKMFIYLLTLGTFGNFTSQKSMTNNCGVTGVSSIQVRLRGGTMFLA